MPSFKDLVPKNLDWKPATYGRLPVNCTGLDRLKSKRTSWRAQNTKIESNASALLANDSATWQLYAVYVRLKTNNDELHNVNANFEHQIPNQELDAKYSTALEYKDNATHILAELSIRKDRMLRSSITAERTVTQTVTAPLDGTQVRLPKLTIALFSGKQRKWTKFRKQLDENVHKNIRIMATEKFYCLRLYLKREAASIVAGLPTTESCTTIPSPCYRGTLVTRLA